MIKVSIIRNKKKYITKLNVMGHSFKKNEKEIEPLCASVSSVILGTVNHLQHNETYVNCCNIIVKSGYVVIKITKYNQEVSAILENVLMQLKTIALFFRKGLIFENEIN